MITYTVFDKDGKALLKRTNAACFWEVYSVNNKHYVEYYAEVRVNSDNLLFYIEFLKGILGTDAWSFGSNKDNPHVFTLTVKGIAYKKILLHLTAFRYVDEYAKCITWLYQFKDKPIEELFRLFIQRHIDYRLHREFNIGGHSLWETKGGEENENAPPSLAVFKIRLAKKKWDQYMSNHFHGNTKAEVELLNAQPNPAKKKRVYKKKISVSQPQTT